MEENLPQMSSTNFVKHMELKDTFSAPRTPQQNGVVERKNSIVLRTKLNEAKLPDIYWREAMYTRMYIINKEQLRFNHNKTPYELCFGRPTSFKHFRDFGRKCYKKRDDYKLGKFDSRSYEGIFLGYSSNKREYKCYNFRLHKILESANVKLDDLNTKGIKSQYNPQFDERIRDDDDE